MSRSEKYLPFVIAFCVPALGIFYNDVFGDEVAYHERVLYYLQVSAVLLGFWFFNKFLLRKTASFSTRKKNSLLILANGFIIFSLVFLGTRGIPNTIEPKSTPYIVGIRLGFLVLIFNIILRVFEAQREKAELTYQNLLLQSENLKFQVETLKQQVNPHFLFNSLNTLLDMVENHNENAVQYIRNFSNLYRVVLQSTKYDFVTLKDELDFLDNYWNLLTARFNEAISLTIDIPEGLEHASIPPLSLQLLVENAVKHNEATRESPLEIVIRGEKEHILVSNKIKPKGFPVKSEQVGLKNLQERFRLLHKVMDWSKEGGYFVVRLPLKTA